MVFFAAITEQWIFPSTFTTSPASKQGTRIFMESLKGIQTDRQTHRQRGYVYHRELSTEKCTTSVCACVHVCQVYYQPGCLAGWLVDLTCVMVMGFTASQPATELLQLEAPLV